MAVVTTTFDIQGKGFSDIIDITDQVAKAVMESGMSDGICLAFVAGSTAGITSIEYESGAVDDLKDALERLAPKDAEYRHNLRWQDGNGFSHVRAALTGAGFALPFVSSRLVLGTWQQIVLMDHDNRQRSRQVIVQIVGE